MKEKDFLMDNINVLLNSLKEDVSKIADIEMLTGMRIDVLIEKLKSGEIEIVQITKFGGLDK
jgi:hypothetical protein